MEDYKRDPCVCGLFLFTTFGKQLLGSASLQKRAKNHLINHVEVLCLVFMWKFCVWFATVHSELISFSCLLIVATSAHAYQKSMDADKGVQHVVVDNISACAREAAKTITIILKFGALEMNIQLECHGASGVTSC